MSLIIKIFTLSSAGISLYIKFHQFSCEINFIHYVLYYIFILLAIIIFIIVDNVAYFS